MRAEPQKLTAQFKPITITLESPEEVASLYALVNHRDIAEAVGQGRYDTTWIEQIRTANEAAGNAKIDYAPLHSKLQALLK